MAIGVRLGYWRCGLANAGRVDIGQMVAVHAVLFTGLKYVAVFVFMVMGQIDHGSGLPISGPRSIDQNRFVEISLWR